jgi:uncharacterized membrane protein
MYKKHKYDIVVVLSLIGFAVSIYLAVYHYLGYLVPCNVTHGCEIVLNSKYSTFLGVPLSVWGIVYFLAVIISSLLANHYMAWRRFLNIVLGIGAAGSLVLLAIQFFVLQKVCQYCFVIDTLNIILFLWNLNVEKEISGTGIQ